MKDNLNTSYWSIRLSCPSQLHAKCYHFSFSFLFWWQILCCGFLLLCVLGSMSFNVMYFVMLSSDALHYNTLQHTTPPALHYYTMHYTALLDPILYHFMFLSVVLSSNLLLCLTLTFSVLDFQLYSISCSQKTTLSFFLFFFYFLFFFFISHYYSLIFFFFFLFLCLLWLQHDATPCHCSFNLTITDTLKGLYLAKQYEFFSLSNFNLKEYVFYEQVRIYFVLYYVKFFVFVVFFLL